MRYSEQWLAGTQEVLRGDSPVPGSCVGALYESVHFFLTIIVGNRFMYPHYAEEEIESMMFSKLPKAE